MHQSCYKSCLHDLFKVIWKAVDPVYSFWRLQFEVLLNYIALQASVNFGSYFRFSLSLQTKMHISFSHFQSFLSSLVLVQFSSTKTQNILVQFQSTKSHYILVQFQSHLKVHLIATLNSFTSLLRPGDPLCCVYNCIIVKLAVLKLWMQLVSKIQISQYMPTAEFQ